MTLVIAGAGDDNQASAAALTLSVRVAQLVAEGASRNEALKRAARERGLTRRAAYQIFLEEQHADEEESPGDA